MDEGSMIWLNLKVKVNVNVNVDERGCLGEGADYVPLDPGSIGDRGCVFWGGVGFKRGRKCRMARILF